MDYWLKSLPLGALPYYVKNKFMESGKRIYPERLYILEGKKICSKWEKRTIHL